MLGKIPKKSQKNSQLGQQRFENIFGLRKHLLNTSRASRLIQILSKAVEGGNLLLFQLLLYSRLNHFQKLWLCWETASYAAAVSDLLLLWGRSASWSLPPTTLPLSVISPPAACILKMCDFPAFRLLWGSSVGHQLTSPPTFSKSVDTVPA